MGIKQWLMKVTLHRISARISSSKRVIKSIVDKTVDQAFHSGMFSLLVVSLVWIAIFFYVTFCYAYIPARSYVRPIHLQINSCDEPKNKCAFPSAHVRLTKRHNLLMKGQQYKFFVRLEMPESPVNKRLGMFMVCLQLKDKNGFLTSQSCRSTMLHYYSEFLHKLQLLIFSPLYTLGYREEKQTILSELYSDFEEDQYHPITDIYVEVRSHNIEIYSATLLINAHLVGLRYFIYHWPTTSAVLGIAFNLFVVFFTVFLSFYNNFFIDSRLVQIVRIRLQWLETQINEQRRRYAMFTDPSSVISSTPAVSDLINVTEPEIIN